MGPSYAERPAATHRLFARASVDELQDAPDLRRVAEPVERRAGALIGNAGLQRQLIVGGEDLQDAQFLACDFDRAIRLQADFSHHNQDMPKRAQSVAARRREYQELRRFPQRRSEPKRKPGIVWHDRWCECMAGGHWIPWR